MIEGGTMDTAGGSSGNAWKRFVRRHRMVTLVLAGGIVAATAAAILVFLWVAGTAQANGLVPSVLGDWTAGHVLTFILNVILWELVLVASWVIPAGLAAYFLWYRKLPDEERREYEGRPRRHRSAGQRGGFSFFVGLVWFVIAWIEGKWNLPLGNWTFNDWVYSWLTAGVVVLLIVGIPGTMYVIWSLRRNA